MILKIKHEHKQKTSVQKIHRNEVFWCDREDSNLWPSGSENYDKPVQTNVEA